MIVADVIQKAWLELATMLSADLIVCQGAIDHKNISILVFLRA
jgi:hypothetical protein